MFFPSVPTALLLGVEAAAPETLFVGRVTGAALLAIGVACGVRPRDNRNAANLGLLIGVLIYDTVAAALLAYAGLGLSMVGIALWPAVVLHTALAVWCVACLRARLRFMEATIHAEPPPSAKATDRSG